jgi:hypothetical protein
LHPFRASEGATSRVTTQTAAQKDQICAIRLEIMNEVAAAPIGGYMIGHSGPGNLS